MGINKNRLILVIFVVLLFVLIIFIGYFINKNTSKTPVTKQNTNTDSQQTTDSFYTAFSGFEALGISEESIVVLKQYIGDYTNSEKLSVSKVEIINNTIKIDYNSQGDSISNVYHFDLMIDKTKLVATFTDMIDSGTRLQLSNNEGKLLFDSGEIIYGPNG